MRRLTAIALALLAMTAVCASAEKYEPAWESLDRRPVPQWWTDAKVAKLAADGEVPLRGAKQKPVPVLKEAEFEALHPGANIDLTTVKDGKPGTFAFLDGKTKGFMLLVK